MKGGFTIEKIKRTLKTLAFGNIDKAVSLIIRAHDGQEEVKYGNALINVESIKKTKDGMEIKFADRFKAIEMLCEIYQNEQNDDDVYSLLKKMTGGDDD